MGVISHSAYSRWLRTVYARKIWLVFFLLAACTRLDNVPGRKFHIINLSLPRSATLSFAGLFADFKPGHEDMIDETVSRLIDYSTGGISRKELSEFLLWRDRASGHWVDSASFFAINPEIVYETFPDAKYFFVMRRCDTWIASMIERMRLLFQVRTRDFPSPDAHFLVKFASHFSPYLRADVLLNDQSLRKNAEPLVRDLALAWHTHTLRVLQAMAAMPPDQRLAILLEDFDNSINIIAQFAGVDSRQLNWQNRHLNRDTNLEAVYRLVDPTMISTYATRQRQLVDIWLEDYPGLLHRVNRRLARKKARSPAQPNIKAG